VKKRKAFQKKRFGEGRFKKRRFNCSFAYTERRLCADAVFETLLSETLFLKRFL